MSIIILNPGESSKIASKKVELLKYKGKYYIEMEEFENSDSIVELSIALASENQALKERIELLEEKLKLYK